MNNSLTKSTDPRLSFYTNYNVSDQAGVKRIVLNSDNTVSFSYTPLQSSTGISSLSATPQQPAETYTLSGVKTTNSRTATKQVVIVKDRNGKGHKVSPSS